MYAFFIGDAVASKHRFLARFTNIIHYCHFLLIFTILRTFLGSLLLSTYSAPTPALEGAANAIMACLGQGCDLDSGPVCVIDDSGVTRTFENRCMANLAYCRYGTCMFSIHF